MSLNTWSIIVFVATTFYFFMVFNAIFSLPSVTKFAMLVVSWVTMVLTTLLYGLSTNQIGFVLLALMEFGSAVFVYRITERMLSDEDPRS